MLRALFLLRGRISLVLGIYIQPGILVLNQPRVSHVDTGQSLLSSLAKPRVRWKPIWVPNHYEGPVGLTNIRNRGARFQVKQPEVLLR